MAYVDFFDEEIKRNDGDWNRVVHNYLFSGPEPIVNGGIGGRMSLSPKWEPACWRENADQI